RQLNKYTPSATPLVTSVPDMMSQLKGTASVYSTLDVANGFWSILVHEGSQYKFAFSYKDKQYTWVGLPQGFHNSPTLFHQCMANILQGVSNPSAIIQYVDNILIQSETKEEHYAILQEVLQLLRKAGLKLNLSKAQLMERIPDSGKVTLVQNLPRPHTVTALRSFWGIVGFCRDFIEGHSEMAAPLYEHLKGNPGKEDMLEWNSQSHEAFLKLKQALLKAPALRSPDPNLPFVVEVAISDTSIISVLMQQVHALTPVEKAFDQCTKQILGIHWVITHTEYICGFNRIIVRTPHSPVALLIKGQLMRVWDLVGEREPNTVAICKLAKLVAQKGDPWEPLTPPTVIVASLQPSLTLDLFRCQQLDPQLGLLRESILNRTPAPEGFGPCMGNIFLHEDVLYHSQPLAWVTPQQLWKPLILYFHQVSGHTSPVRVLEMLQGCYWWPSMKQVVEDCLQLCLVCAQMNPLPRAKQVQLGDPLVPHGPWDALQIDYIGPLPPAKGGYKHILVVVDIFTRWVEAFPTRRNDAFTTAKVLWEQIFTWWGFPRRIESDNGTHFTAEVMQAMCSMLGIQQAFHIPYHPQSSGMVERFSRTIKSETMIRSSPDWVQALPGVLMVIRGTKIRTTGYSPYELMTGRQMPL
uniref:Gypsy retrotransposon integrase-like protein 1 n=1 Tax=Latimeria chalumnae TaxID=7897 RepID=H3BG99_LATCH